MNKYLMTIVGLLLLFFGLALTLGKYSGSSAWVWQVSQQGQWFFPLLTVSAIVDSINPCAFSILIVSLIFLFSVGSTTSKVIRYGLVYIFGIFVAYFLIGLGLLQALHIFNTPHFMSKVGAVMLVIFGTVSILEVLIPSFPIKLGVPQGTHQKMNQLLEKMSLPAMFLLGGLVGLCEFPCTCGPYLMVVGLLHDTGTYLTGLGYLLLYNVIFILPLVVILWLASHERLTERVRAWQNSEKKSMRVLLGVAMIALGLLMFVL